MKNERDGPVFEKLVNAVSLIGLTTETAEYLFEHDPIALKVVDEALDLLGTPVTTLRNRSVDHYIEEGYLPRLGNTFLPLTQNGVDHESVSQYITEHLDSPNGSWELVFFPDNEPEPTGVNEDHTNMVEIMDMIEDELDEFDEAFVKLDDTHTEEEHVAEMGTDDWVKHLERQGANPFKQRGRRSRHERRSFEERRSGDNRRWTGRNGGDRRRNFTPTHHGVDTCEYE